jgi:23S rRNA-/tRNA-specific pseudouridylate synthase
VKILHRDEHLLVIAKPPGLLSQPDRTGDVDVVSLGKDRLAGEDGTDPFLGLVHRLDRPASGVMVWLAPRMPLGISLGSFESASWRSAIWSWWRGP